MRNTIFNQPLFTGMIDNMLNRTISDIVGTDYMVTTPSANIVEEDNHYKIDLAAPGLEKSDFSIKVEKNHIIISAEKSESTDEYKGKYTRKEYNFTSFTRSFQLPEEADAEQITASYTNGVLSIQIGKKTVTVNSYKTVEIL